MDIWAHLRAVVIEYAIQLSKSTVSCSWWWGPQNLDFIACIPTYSDTFPVFLIRHFKAHEPYCCCKRVSLNGNVEKFSAPHCSCANYSRNTACIQLNARNSDLNHPGWKTGGFRYAVLRLIIFFVDMPTFCRYLSPDSRVQKAAVVDVPLVCTILLNQLWPAPSMG